MGYAVACGHRFTARAAEEVLKEGGNAIDAVIAAFATSWITEPCMSSPGGGAFAVIRFNKKLFALDCFAKTPGLKKPKEAAQYIPVYVDFGGTKELFYAGLGSCAIPGSIDGMYKLHELGGTMPMQELLQPAIRFAKEGIGLDPFQHYDIYLLRDIITQSDIGKALFFPDGELVPEGTVIARPLLADFIDYLSHEGPSAFYQGEIAHRIVNASRKNGGHISLTDLNSYESELNTPLKTQLGRSKIYTHGSPSLGSHILAELLQILKGSDYIIDDLIKGLAQLQIHKEAGKFDELLTTSGGLKPGGTSHISIVDHDQNAVSLSMSIGEGSGYFIEGTGIHLNNMLGEESLLPGGIHSWRENSRMASMMTPALMIEEADNAVSALGSGGASRIPTMIGQVIHHHLKGSKQIAKAIEHPRLHYSDNIWQAEPGLIKPAHLSKEKWNSWEKQSLYFGGVHCASFIKKGYEAIGDSRRHGVGIVG